MTELTPDTAEDVLENLVKTGGPAFPSKMTTLGAEFYGLTLRDYFAAAALTGILAYDPEWPVEKDAGSIAHSAYRTADAMLKERSK